MIYPPAAVVPGTARYLLSGVLTCAHCGHSAIASTQQTREVFPLEWDP